LTDTYRFDEDIRLEYYRLQKISEGAIGLKEGEAKPLDGPTETGSGVSRDAIALSRLVDLINERFGTDFNEADQLFFDQIIEQAAADEELRQAAAANPEDKFALLFGNMLQTLFIERMEQNEDIFARYMNEKDFQQMVGEWISKQVYQRLRKKPSSGH
jgi:type I restriction enzyme R subunit